MFNKWEHTVHYVESFHLSLTQSFHFYKIKTVYLFRAPWIFALSFISLSILSILTLKSESDNAII